MEHEHDNTAARELLAELRQLADTILDLEARGRLLEDAPRLLKLLGDARSKIFSYEVRFIRGTEKPSPHPSGELADSNRVVEEAAQREQEAEQEWLKPWERHGEAEL